MKRKLTTIKLFPFLLLLVISCNTPSPNNTSLGTKHEQYDTIFIDLDAINEAAQLRDEKYDRMPISELVDSLKTLASFEKVRELKDSESLFGGHQEMDKYYINNIPKSVYKKIFPTAKMSIEKISIRDTILNEANKKLYLKYGTEIIEERAYKNLYSFIEKEKFLQLIFTKQGKYNPELELLTVSKPNLKVIGNLNLFGGIYDSYDIDYWHSEFSDDFRQVKMTHVKNKSFTKVNLDTTHLVYRITDSGEISKE